MAVAIAALAVAVGGVAFAALPGEEGEISACYHKQSGALRVVESADACRSSEQAIAWNQRGPQGPQGAQVVARIRGGPFETEAGTFRPVPLSPDSWTQAAGEFQVVHVDIKLATPRCTVQGTLRVDGEIIHTFLLSATGSPHDLNHVPLFESDATTTHTLSVEARANNFCPPDGHTGTLEYVKANVVSFD